MISPVTSPYLAVRKNLFLKNTKNKLPIVQNNSFEYSTNSINFTGYPYMPIEDNFRTTVNKNYFQLPKVRLKNGELYQLQPDENQIRAAKELYDGNSVLYSVSTGSGKTAVAHWAITRNLSKNKKTIFTVPTKALANDKYDEFCKIYGKNRTGILTGDKKINPAASVIIMTTEIYDKQVESGVFNSQNAGTVIYDEAHYISDDERGTAWENSIIESAKRNIQILLLSATIGNCEKFRGWLQSLNPDRCVKKIEVDPQERYVPQLYYSYFDEKFTPLIDGTYNFDSGFSKRQNRALEIIFKAKENKDIDYKIQKEELSATLQELKENVKKEGFNPKKLKYKELKVTLKNNYPYLNDDNIEAVANLLLDPKDKIIKTFHNPYQDSNYSELVYHMKQNNMLPAIIYRLSKRKCEDTAKDIAFAEPNLELTTDEEKQQIKKIIAQYQKDKNYLGFFTELEKEKLLNGIGVHHSSKAPEYKKLIEDLFRKKLLKVVVATSTLGVGIDMPAKSTVITDMTYRQTNPVTQKAYYKPITVNEFYQMIGRAGRRGQDSVGNVIIYNPYNADKKNGNYKENKIDEERLIQEYLVSTPDNLTSSFEPSASLVAQYYLENDTSEELRDIIKDSFKIYISRYPEAELSSLIKKFEKCTSVLIRQGYMYKNNDKNVYITPKGKILALSKCSNTLMLSSLLYDKNLKDVSVEEFCQIAGYIAGSERVKDNSETPEFKKMLSNRVLGLQIDIEEKKQKQIFDTGSGYNRAKAIFQNKENIVLKNSQKSDLDFDGKAYSNELSGFITYCWAILNRNNQNSISNFNKILTFSLADDKEATKNTYKSKATPGDNYKIIAQTVSILKQINYICNFALENEDEFPETEYWQSIKEKSELAIKLMNKEPINEKMEEEPVAFIKAKKLPINTCPICQEPMAEEYKAQKYAQNMLYLKGEEAKEYIENGIEKGFLYPMAQDDTGKLVFNQTAFDTLNEIKYYTAIYPNLDVKGIIELLSQEYSDEIKLDRIMILDEIHQYVKENIKDREVRLEFYSLIKETTDEIYEKSDDEFQNRKFRYKINKIIQRYIKNQVTQKELDSLVAKLPSSKDDMRAFFIKFNKQSSYKIASAFANKKVATATTISPFIADSEKLDNYIKICTPCRDDRAETEFTNWIFGIKDFKGKIKDYIEKIKLNSPKTDPEQAIVKNYTENLYKRIEKIEGD